MPTKDNTAEAVARAVAESDGEDWDSLSEPVRNEYRRNAPAAIRATLLAIREPTPEMVEASFECAGQTSLNARGERRRISIAWHSMIDKLLEDA